MKLNSKMMRKFASCPFQTLGLKENASKVEIKKKYYELAKKYHPDVNQEYTRKFQDINSAYKILMENALPKNNTKTYDLNKEMQQKEKLREKFRPVSNQRTRNGKEKENLNWTFKHYFAM